MHVIFFLNTIFYTDPNKLRITSNGSTNFEIRNLQNGTQICENNKKKIKNENLNRLLGQPTQRAAC
jgi:hypothetical protein